ncbi:metal-dependent transcriptional regulator [Monoglobus pectinilyticus]|uniref:metal-dependent transcriptional regulator n=1 Tax=Monoglobus pectinilyticus TaxID=1981510 RepID=UPI00399C13DB
MKIMESAENYLETILVLSNKGDKVRSIDIVTETGYTKPSISRAVKSLKESGYISVDVHGYIDLLPSGRAIAEKICERHRFLSKYLMKIGVSEETALTDACRIEHVISEESFDKLKEFVRTLEQNS